MNAQVAAFAFADALSRERALTREETEMLVGLNHAKGTGGRMWTARDDRLLKRLARTMRAPQIAEEMGRTAWAVRSRVRVLKRKERAGE